MRLTGFLGVPDVGAAGQELGKNGNADGPTECGCEGHVAVLDEFVRSL